MATGQDDVPAESGRRVAFLEGQVHALELQLAAMAAADEHHRVELDAARAEAADARAAEREWQGRLEEHRRLSAEIRGRLETAEEKLRRAEEEGRR
ncbi:MAG: hypothetical protein ACRDJ9_34200 [Dehalococcoidia bacterium]